MDLRQTYGVAVNSIFLIDEKGKVIDAWYKVSPKDTVPKAMKALS
jgi:peroxiredoxin Q/BCP